MNNTIEAARDSVNKGKKLFAQLVAEVTNDQQKKEPVIQTASGTKWSTNGRMFQQCSATDAVCDRLPFGIYNIIPTPKGVFLEARESSFQMPGKIYGLEEAFIERMLKTYAHTRGNLGILMNGIRGTGKTITAERIALQLGLPIIVVAFNFPGLTEFLASVPQDVTFLFDEFEKVFDEDKNEGQSLLPLMDGALSSGTHRRVFLLTTNELHVERNLIQRPGRVRYVKTFNNLPRETIEAIVDDLLVDKSTRNVVIKFIAQLELITVDIVISVVEELNIHGGDPTELLGLFNIKRISEVYDVFIVNPVEMTEKNLRCNVHVKPNIFTEDAEDCEDSYLFVGQDNVGTILKVEGDHVTVQPHGTMRNAEGKEEKHAQRIFRIEPRPSYNYGSFGRNYKAIDMAYE
jgi:hypothetical protein